MLSYSLAEQDNVRIQVSDEGMGIAKDDQEHIFERYFRAQSSKMGSIARFGIGLYLCREIIELHDGLIEVHSSEGLGTMFNVILPIESRDPIL